MVMWIQGKPLTRPETHPAYGRLTGDGRFARVSAEAKTLPCR